MRRLKLEKSATVGKAFLAAFDDDQGLQAGPIWLHDWDDDSGMLTLTAGGMWTYFDHVSLLPVLAGRLPTDKTTDTRYMPIDTAPDSTYPWPSDTRKSLQGIARALVAQAQAETNGNVPVILPAEILGTAERAYRGTDVAMVGQRLSELTKVLGGPDIKFISQWTTDRLGVQWVLQIGTPTQPLISSPQEQVFYKGVARQSSVTKLRVKTSGAQMGNRAFSSGGAAAGEALVSVSTDTTLTNAGYARMDLVDQTRSTVSELGELQAHSDELVLAGRTPTRTIRFTHDLTTRPTLGSLATGDFSKLRVKNNLYLPDGEYRIRLISRSGDVAKPNKVDLAFAPEVV